MRPRLVLLGGIIVALIVGCETKNVSQSGAAKTVAMGSVTMEVVQGETTKQFVVHDVAEGTTLEAVMRQAKDLPIELKGSGWTAFVQSIDGVATNQTEGWTYKVDGEHANVGIGSLELSPPVTITWSFGAWESMPIAE